jgi:hypothetical protein
VQTINKQSPVRSETCWLCVAHPHISNKSKNEKTSSRIVMPNEPRLSDRAVKRSPATRGM